MPQPVQPSKATVTAPIGPGRSITGFVFNDVKVFTWDITAGVLSIVTGADRRAINLDAANVSTVTQTVSAGQHTITVS